VQRFVRAQYPKPAIRVRRRIETPPGAQAQAEWAEFRNVVSNDNYFCRSTTTRTAGRA
jgi:hypothetical protein